ncbi:MAG: hypothetical protein GX456_02145, partial [Verrucomicrobia bacterium]|nr:hypothetical protein [Verrucomicrobiota bacterium]
MRGKAYRRQSSAFTRNTGSSLNSAHAQFHETVPPKGGTLTAADALGVGSREAFGVRQLAAALFLCPNNVPVPIPRHLQ